MANGLYDKAREGFLAGSLSWTNDTIQVLLVDSAYNVNLSQHTTLIDIPNSARVGVSTPLTNKTATAGVADATDVTFPIVTNGKQVSAVILYQAGVDDASSKLVAYIDSAAGLPFTGNGASTTIQWDNGANRIFKL